MSFKSNQKGFTLIELVVVIVILGILAAIAVPRYLDLTANASAAADNANAKTIEAAVLMHFANEVMADNSYTLTDAVTDYNADSDGFFSDGVTPTKSDGTAFVVSISGDGSLLVQ